MKLKICGLTNLPDARYCAAAGADFLGFIRYAPSPRYVDADTSRNIVDWLAGAEPVGVYVNETPQTINADAAACGFTWVQLSGDETPEVCAQVEKPILKGIRVKATDTAETIGAILETYLPYVQYFLLDTYHKDLYGGTGETFNWALAATLAAKYPLFLAGGLGADNIEAGIKAVNPAGVDLSSRLEAQAGVKDFDKVDAFFEVWHAITLPA